MKSKYVSRVFDSTKALGEMIKLETYAEQPPESEIDLDPLFKYSLDSDKYQEFQADKPILASIFKRLNSNQNFILSKLIDSNPGSYGENIMESTESFRYNISSRTINNPTQFLKEKEEEKKKLQIDQSVIVKNISDYAKCYDSEIEEQLAPCEICLNIYDQNDHWHHTGSSLGG